MCDSLGIDSRNIKRGAAFLALRGERFDGHDFLTEAAEAGAALLIVDDERKVHAVPEQASVLRVADTGEALLSLARAFRRSQDALRVIAVTGTNGKTTTAGLIHSILSQRLRGSVSPKSFNNRVGVPLTILAARPGDQFVVCEVGTNAPGEISELARTIEPDVAVITSIGQGHLEGLRTLQGVADEKASLLSYLRPGGLAVVTAECDLIDDHLRTVSNVVTFGRNEGADLRVTAIDERFGPDGRPIISFRVNDRADFTAPVPGSHNALNICAAIAVARRFGLEQDSIESGLAQASLPDMRLAVQRLGGVALLNDAYNANPDSMRAALESFDALFTGATRRVVILGDMLELGLESAGAHRAIGDILVAGDAADLVIAVGHEMLHAVERLERNWEQERYQLFGSLTAQTASRIAGLIEPGDAVLIKGSRGMGLERIAEAIERRYPAGASTQSSPTGVAEA